MKNFWTYKFLVLEVVVILILSSCYKEYDISVHPPTTRDFDLLFNEQPVAYDSVRKMMLFSVEQPSIENFRISIASDVFTIEEIDDKLVDDENNYEFDEINTEDDYFVKIQYPDGRHDFYYLQFTTMPIIQVFTSEPVLNDLKISSRIIITDPKSVDKTTDAFAGIEIRGGTAIWNPKKSYALEFWQDSLGDFQKDVSLFGLMADDDWILDAMYVDKLRMRKAFSRQLWDSLQYRNIRECNLNLAGVEGGFVEVFHNGIFLGLYNLTERIDKKRLGIREADTNLQGLIFKAEYWAGPTKYESMTERSGGLEWGGWELKYPEDWGDDVWIPFQDYIDFVVNSEDVAFSDSIYEYINMSNAIDYYILINATKAIDNWGKNLYMVRYDSESPYIIIPWDMDATWGRTWKSEPEGFEDILSNGLYERLMELEPNNYNSHLTDRWWELRSEILSEFMIFSILDDLKTELVSSGAYQRELDTWPESELNIYEEVEYVKSWTTDRLNYLDSYFTSL